MVERYYAQFQQPGFLVDDLMAYYADDIVFTDPTFGIRANGKADVRKLYADLGTENTDYTGIAWKLREPIIDGDFTVIRGTWSGRFYHCPFSVEFTTIWRLRNELIAEQTDFFAASEFDRQVAWDPASGRATCTQQ